MGRAKIEIKKIEDNKKRHVTFSKRRPNLFGKAARLCTLTNAEIAIIVFSSSGKLFAFGHPSVDQVIQRYNNGGITIQDSVSDNDYSELSSKTNATKRENNFWWENIELDNCSLVELEKMEKALEQLRHNVRSRLSLLPVNEDENGNCVNENDNGNVVVEENQDCSSYYSDDDIVQEYLRQDICDQLPTYA
ncbi:hypothetical protein ACHQM5_008518 [Ranunculus cassubicifolius]